MAVKTTTQGMDSLDTDTFPRDRPVGFGRSTAARGKRFRCALDRADPCKKQAAASRSAKRGCG